MTRLPAAAPLVRALYDLLPRQAAGPPAEVILEPLPSSRPVLRFIFPEGQARAVGKFFTACPPESSLDRSLLQEYDNYFQAAALGLGDGLGLIPRVLGRHPQLGLGLLLENLPGVDLDCLLARALRPGEEQPLYRGLEHLAGLLAFFHTRPVPESPVSPYPALSYFDKLRYQLQALGLLSVEDKEALKAERGAWEDRFSKFPDRRVLVHGDATPTNFLFDDGRVVALDLERLKIADRLWDLSWVAGELKHAWGWRTGNLNGGEAAISRFFAAYLAALPADAALAPRLYFLNPFYMALAELRIARNAYLSRDYRLTLIAEARRCLAAGRRL